MVDGRKHVLPRKENRQSSYLYAINASVVEEIMLKTSWMVLELNTRML